MSRYFSSSLLSLAPYTPGEQPRDLSSFIKLNTNENPFPFSRELEIKALERMRNLNLYPDPSQSTLREKLASFYGVEKKNVTLSNGSDELLLFSFLAFCCPGSVLLTPDITYSFYNTLSSLVGLRTKEIPLLENFRVDTEAFMEADGTVVLANPNALTGVALSVKEVEKIIRSRPGRIVIIDEAYVDFGSESVLPLIEKYPNLVVVRTFSKSRSLAGARVGYAFADEELIGDIERVRNSINPYNINSFTLCAAEVKLSDELNTQKYIEEIKRTREYTSQSLERLGFIVLPSSSNFIFVSHPLLEGDTYYRELRKRGILIRHFSKERIALYSRITIGRREDMAVLIEKTEEILNERI